MEEKSQWYNNKELYEMLLGLKDELKETRAAVQKYNGLRADLNHCMTDILAIKQQAVGRYSVGKAIRDWGGWIVAVVSFIYLLMR